MLSKNGPEVGVIIATGPSLTQEQLDIVREGQDRGLWLTFGMNHIWKTYPDLDVFIACNPEYYDYYWDEGLKYHPCEKWTWHKETAHRYAINYVEGRWEKGLSTDPRFIHYGHSSGYQAPGIAYHYGIRKMLLLGYDMSFAKDYDGKARQVGSKPRHFFGEYPSQLQHWPSVKIKDGVFTELIQQFEDIKTINPEVEIINCTPNSAMTCFPMASLDDFLESNT